MNITKRQNKEYTQLLNILVDTWFSTSFDAQLLTVIMDTISYRFMVDFSVTLVDLTINLNEI